MQEWSTEGYQLLCIQSQVKSLEIIDEKQNFSPKQPNVVFVLDFVKSILALNPCISNSYILLQGDDKLYINHGESLQKVYSNSTFKSK
jgi:RAB6A-GEF complex partner protein 1